MGQNQHPGSFSESTDQGLSFGTKIYAKHAKLLKIWAPNVWLKLYLYLSCFCQDFIGQVKILKPVFSGPKSQNDKVSVLIGNIISWSFQNSPTFYS